MRQGRVAWSEIDGRGMAEVSGKANVAVCAKAGEHVGQADRSDRSLKGADERVVGRNLCAIGVENPFDARRASAQIRIGLAQSLNVFLDLAFDIPRVPAVRCQLGMTADTVDDDTAP